MSVGRTPRSIRSPPERPRHGALREPTTFEDWHAINALLMTYAEHVDAGRYADVGAMFEHAVYRIEHADGEHVSTFEGSEQVQAFCEQTRIYPDSTPRTKHVITNVMIDVDGDRRELTLTARFSSRPTCSHSNQLLRDATSTGSSGS